MADIKLYSAGAGTGKTFKICEEIADRIASGLDPRRILAATFTRKAAAELKSRIQGHLLGKGLVQKAEELEFASMGTVHSVGHQLVSRFALRLGLSPELTVMPEGTETTWLNNMVTCMDPAPMEMFHALSGRFEQSVKIIFDLIGSMRQNNIPAEEFRRQLTESAGRLCKVIGNSSARNDISGFPEAMKEAQKCVKQALEKFKREPDHENDVANDLVRFVQHGAENWRALANLEKLKSKCKAADEHLKPIRAFAENLLVHPGLGAEIMAFAESLAEQALTLDEHYRRYKRERGLLDYNDLEELFYKLVTASSLREELSEEIQLVVIDEFQDTNPIQLAIFMSLSELARESIWVGDPKQSIYAFNGADPALMNAVWERPDVKRGNLKTNRRSAEGLVDLINAVFTPVFGTKSKLDAHRKGATSVIERWLLDAKNNGDEARALANGVSDLVKNGAKKNTIAILTRSNAYAQNLGAELQNLGIPVSLNLSGLLSTRECAALVAALRVVADRRDSLACATLLHLLDDESPETSSWLKHRLDELQKDEKSLPFASHPLIEGLGSLDHRNLSPSAALTSAMDLIGICAKVGDWTEPARRNTHLDAIFDQALAYEETTAVEGRAVTLAGFISHLDDLESEGMDERKPPHGLDAVNILTYHGAKGLEWPIVILAQLDTKYEGRPTEPWVEGGHPERGKPLDGRVIQFWPCPFGAYPSAAFKEAVGRTVEQEKLCRKENEESLRLLYVGFTRARDQLILASRVSKLKDGDKHKHAWLDLLPSFSEVAGAITPGVHKLKGISADLIVRRISNTPQSPVSNATLSWLKESESVEQKFISRLRSPSQEPPTKVEMKAEPLPTPHPDFGKVTTAQFDLLGDAVHAYFGALPSLSATTDIVRLASAKRALANFDMAEAIKPEALVESGERFKAWVENNYPDSTWHTEVPMTAPAKDGRQWHGVIDLLLKLPDGRAVIIDHKSALINAKAWLSKAEEYSGQLLGYAEALKACGVKDIECWIHFPLGGGVVKLS